MRPLSGSGRSQPSSKRSSAHALSPSTGRRWLDERGERPQLLLGAGSDQRRGAADASTARHRQRPPRGPLAADPRERRKRDVGGVEPHRGLHVAEALDDVPEAGLLQRRQQREHGRRPLRITPVRVGRQHLEALERHEQRALGELDLGRLAAEPPQQREHDHVRFLRVGRIGDLAVGGLEAVRHELELALATIEHAVQEAAQRVGGGGRRRAALVGVGFEVRAQVEARERSTVPPRPTATVRASPSASR